MQDENIKDCATGKVAIEQKQTRQSNFELLRIVCMLFIVFYHLLFFFIAEVDDSILYRALYIPLHIAVLCFVLISGYFNIKPSMKGVVKLSYLLLLTTFH